MASHQERVKQTKGAIVEALVTIGATKALPQITVSDLTRTSGISRGTFYLHYLDKDDFVSQLEMGITTEIQTILARDMDHAMDYQQLVTGEPYPFVVELVDLAARNRRLLNFLFGPNGDPAFNLMVTNILQQAVRASLKQVKGTPHFTAEMPQRYALRLIINSIMTIIHTWLEGDDQLEQKAVCALIMRALFLSPYQLLGIE